MAQETILVIDDDQNILDIVEYVLGKSGYHVQTARSGREGLYLLQQSEPALVILDLMMPQPDGLEVIRRVRRESVLPILVLTAIDEEAEMVEAFTLGADDFLTKPFSLVELRLRVQALLRRVNWSERLGEHSLLRFGSIEVDPEARRVFRDGQPVDLTQTEFDLLMQLVQHPGKVLSHRMLLQRIWGRDYGNEAQYVRVYISRLRQKLETEPSSPRYIRTAPGMGYYLDP